MQINDRRSILKNQRKQQHVYKFVRSTFFLHWFAFLGFAVCSCGHLFAYLGCRVLHFLHFGRFAVGPGLSGQMQILRLRMAGVFDRRLMSRANHKLGPLRLPLPLLPLLGPMWAYGRIKKKVYNSNFPVGFGDIHGPTL